MPTVLAKDGFVVKVWGPPREHPPPHVHVHKGTDGLIIVRLSVGEKPAAVWAYYNVRAHDVVHAFRIVEEHEAEIRAVWERIHGPS